jgi:hypothetical protein
MRNRADVRPSTEGEKLIVRLLTVAQILAKSKDFQKHAADSTKVREKRRLRDSVIS